MLADWQCEIAGATKGNLQGRSDILVSTGGGSYLATSAQDPYFSCAALDVIAIHAYGLVDLTKEALEPYVKKAQNSGKKLIMQEWGMCYYDTSNNNCPTGNALSTLTRDNNIKKYADAIGLASIPWMYWQIIPNGDPHYGYDYEVREPYRPQDEKVVFCSLAIGWHRPSELGCPQGCFPSRKPVRRSVRFF